MLKSKTRRQTVKWKTLILRKIKLREEKLREVDWMDEDSETGQANSTANTW